MADLVSTEQLIRLRQLTRETGIDADRVCADELYCRVDTLSKTGAAWLIAHLEGLMQGVAERLAS